MDVYNLVFKEYPDMLTAEQVAEILEIHINTARTMMKNNELHSRKVGKRYIVSKLELMRFLNILE